jgi:hypothetical protein
MILRTRISIVLCPCRTLYVALFYQSGSLRSKAAGGIRAGTRPATQPSIDISKLARDRQAGMTDTSASVGMGISGRRGSPEQADGRRDVRTGGTRKDLERFIQESLESAGIISEDEDQPLDGSKTGRTRGRNPPGRLPHRSIGG